MKTTAGRPSPSGPRAARSSHGSREGPRIGLLRPTSASDVIGYGARCLEHSCAQRILKIRAEAAAVQGQKTVLVRVHHSSRGVGKPRPWPLLLLLPAGLCSRQHSAADRQLSQPLRRFDGLAFALGYQRRRREAGTRADGLSGGRGCHVMGEYSFASPSRGRPSRR
jgi:hypothetical protein